MSNITILPNKQPEIVLRYYIITEVEGTPKLKLEQEIPIIGWEYNESHYDFAVPITPPNNFKSNDPYAVIYNRVSQVWHNSFGGGTTKADLLEYLLAESEKLK